MAYRLVQIDELNRSDHYYLEDDDKCFYVMEYTSGQDYRFSKANSLIKNFKKTLDKRNLPEWPWKGRAISEISSILRQILTEESLNGFTIVPVPPSKCKDDDLYDDRLVQLLNLITFDFQADIREILCASKSMIASHDTVDRSTPEELEAVYEIDESTCKPTPKKIIIFDDMITAGAHFRACKNILSTKFPKAEIIGVFITRRVLPLRE